jgi:hypothetical protein
MMKYSIVKFFLIGFSCFIFSFSPLVVLLVGDNNRFIVQNRSMSTVVSFLGISFIYNVINMENDIKLYEVIFFVFRASI